MKLSEILFSSATDLWNVSAEKPFVTEMAKGTLDEGLFKQYMLQDYLYILDYVEILRRIKDLADEEDVILFLSRIIEETLAEAERVHLPNMKKLGIGDGEIRESREIPAVSNYLGYMQKCIDEYGLMGGLTALLQCSWLYAYIGERVTGKYTEEIATSQYKSWFDAYTSKEYIHANQMWIDILDELGSDMSKAEINKMCDIFKECAVYENKLWDALYGM